MRIAIVALVVAFLAAIGGARLAFEATSAAGADAADEPWAQDKMEFVAWNGERWTAWIRDGAFELVPENTGSWSRHSNDTLAFVDWNAEPWQAKVDDGAFLLARRGDWQGETERVQALEYRDWYERNRIRTVAQLTR